MDLGVLAHDRRMHGRRRPQQRRQGEGEGDGDEDQPHIDVALMVAELGGSTSHLASLGRERGIPMVLGVLDATNQIPDGATVGVDGIAGIVRWIPASKQQM